MLEKTGLWLTLVVGFLSIIDIIIVLLLTQKGVNMITTLLYILLILLIIFICGSIIVYLSLFRRIKILINIEKSIKTIKIYLRDYMRRLLTSQNVPEALIENLIKKFDEEFK